MLQETQSPELEDVLKEWDKTHTFHHKQFEDIDKLVKLKEEQNLTISLGIPTRNEEKTIKKIVKTNRKYLMEKYPLLDEIAVIDSDSEDRTRKKAMKSGADVYRTSEYLTRFGNHPGKGENLWKSLYLLKGDIIVWIDADIKKIHPRFVYGLVGALLYHPDIQYVKAFYRRPLNLGHGHSANEGGRITECTARPLFNLLYPKLSYIRQPCSGEYAGKRELLEQLKFPTGYFVETSHLIEIEEKFGLDVIGQVDLEERVHRNQRTVDLGKMGYAIIKGVLKKNKDFGYLLPKLGSIYRLPQNNYENPFKSIEIDDTIRPPMETVEEYKGKYHNLYYPLAMEIERILTPAPVGIY